MLKVHFLLALLLLAGTCAAAPPTLTAGRLTLAFEGDAAGGYRPTLTGDGVRVDAPAGVVANVLRDGDARATRHTARYTSFDAAAGGAVDARAVVTTPAGTRVEVVDRYAPAGDGTFRVDRAVTVAAVGDGESAYGTEMEWAAPPGVRDLDDAQIFVPGVWYADASHTPPSGLIDPLQGQRDMLLREDRMALPLVAVRSKAGGWAITLEHRDVDGATVEGEDTADRVVDAGLQFASLGVRRDEGGLRAVLCFPGTEGEQSAVGGYQRQAKWVERLHPLRVGAMQSYAAGVRLSRHERFIEQVRDSWRSAFDAAKPDVIPADQTAVFDASIDCLDFYGRDFDGTQGWPFAVLLPSGKIRDVSMQMGFVGMQIPCGTYLIDEGVRRGDQAMTRKGERVLDFWADHAMSEAGVPRTWWDVGENPHFRDYHTFLRVSTDGANGLLRGWQVARAAGVDKPRWLAFCRRFGDGLLRAQNGDGSWFREFTFDGKPASQSKTSTLHPVRFLVDLAAATGDGRYRRAAVRAGEYGVRAAGGAGGDAADYVGGTPDNPDVKDKEAGWIAFDSFLALYDVTQDRRWLDAAAEAATFTETWLYCWDVPLRTQGLEIPRVRTTGTVSLIALGHSGADCFLAYAALAYYRLSLYTGDEHYARVARLLANNTKQLVDVGGSLGYGHQGLLVEAMSLAVRRGKSVGGWLPWCTSAIIDPMVGQRAIFGSVDLAAVEAMPADERDRLHRAFAATRGFSSEQGR